MSCSQIFYPHFFAFVLHTSPTDLGIRRIFAVRTKDWWFIWVFIEGSINPIQKRGNPCSETFFTASYIYSIPLLFFMTSASAVNPNKNVLISLYVSQWSSTIPLKIFLSHFPPPGTV